MRRAPASRLGLVGAVVVILGCGGPVSFRGVVTLDGKPLPKAHIVLTAVDRAAEGPFVGDTDTMGHFALGPIGRPGGGVRPGRYRLSISTAFSMDSDGAAPQELVPASHVNGVDYEVGAGGNSAVTLDLKSAAKPR